MNLTATEVQSNSKYYFRNKRPTPKEYIYIITKKMKVNHNKRVVEMLHRIVVCIITALYLFAFKIVGAFSKVDMQKDWTEENAVFHEMSPKEAAAFFCPENRSLVFGFKKKAKKE